MASVTSHLGTVDLSRAAAAARRPMIVADNAHVTYKVYASGKRFNARDDLFSLRAMRGGRQLQTVPALRGVTFTASEGETIGVVGHNGSGKSTLFRAMSGLIPTSEGTIWAADRPVLLGVNAALMPDLSGENNIKLGLLAMGFTAEEAAARVDEIADFAELNEFIHHPMRTYSSGMGARLRFAIASAKAHSILLIDEALSVGDRRFKAKSEQRIRELRDSAGLVMIVSHSVSALTDTCERVLWIHKGELRADGPAADVIADYVKWTKQPGSKAVGAASAAPKAASRPASAKAPRAAAAAAPAAPSGARAAEAGASDLEQLFAEKAGPGGAAAMPTDAAPTEPLGSAPAAPSERAPEGAATTGSAPTTPIRQANPRAAARRERYHREVRQQTRKRIIALTITGVAILIAIGAGAAIALVANLPQPQERTPALGAVAAQRPDGSVPPAIVTFGAVTPTAACEAPEGEVDVELTWEVADATRVALAAGATEVDAIAEPMQTDLQALALGHAVPFPCTDETRVYTLTVEGADGNRVSSTVTVAREIPEPEQQPPTYPERPRGGVQAPPATNPQAPPPQPEPSVEPQPQPSTEPTTEPPTEPEPEPEPEPTVEPDPDPTETAPSA